MLKTSKTLIRRLINKLGYDVVSLSLLFDNVLPPDFDEATTATFRSVQPFTLTTKERIFVLCRSVEYLVQHNIPGDIVECGVWRGGSMMAVAQTLVRLGARRKLHLFDTFQGMPQPEEVDKNFADHAAADIMKKENKDTSHVWACSPLDEVKKNLASTSYDPCQTVFVEGKVEDSVPSHAPAQISLLRLDTDWYASTYHELVHLFPRLSVGGVLIIDDYGHWKGARKAVDQYMKETSVKMLLNRVDYSCRIGVKLEA